LHNRLPLEAVMKGYQLTFYTEQSRRQGRQTVVDWLLAKAKQVGIQGATVITATEGVSHAGVHHAARFFELTDQPLQVIFAVTEIEAQLMFDAIQRENVHVFYTRCPIEFGMMGADEPVQRKVKRFSLLHRFHRAAT
jgi:PII-like signaling protein